MPPSLDNPLVWALTQYNVQLWLFVLIRLSGLMMTLPALGQERIPRVVRVCMVGLMTIVVAPVAPLPDALPQTAWGLVGYALCELTIGLILGAVVSWLVEMVGMAGQLLDMQMGFSFAQLIDPGTSNSSAFAGTILIQCTVLFTLISGLHRQMILALVDTYRILPMGSAPPIRPMEMVGLFGQLLAKGFQLSMPVLLVLMFVNVLEAFAAKFMPQLHIIQLSFPLKIAVGLFVFAFMLQEFGAWLVPVVERMPEWSLRMLQP
jgi:flagellar biosynthetic protein FliR